MRLTCGYEELRDAVESLAKIPAHNEQLSLVEIRGTPGFLAESGMVVLSRTTEVGSAIVTFRAQVEAGGDCVVDAGTLRKFVDSGKPGKKQTWDGVQLSAAASMLTVKIGGCFAEIPQRSGDAPLLPFRGDEEQLWYGCPAGLLLQVAQRVGYVKAKGGANASSISGREWGNCLLLRVTEGGLLRAEMSDGHRAVGRTFVDLPLACPVPTPATDLQGIGVVVPADLVRWADGFVDGKPFNLAFDGEWLRLRVGKQLAAVRAVAVIYPNIRRAIPKEDLSCWALVGEQQLRAAAVRATLSGADWVGLNSCDSGVRFFSADGAGQKYVEDVPAEVGGDWAAVDEKDVVDVTYFAQAVEGLRCVGERVKVGFAGPNKIALFSREKQEQGADEFCLVAPRRN
jgi:hypothetical protein